MRVKPVLGALALLTCLNASAQGEKAGSVGGNGGDVVFCKENGVEVMRTLDSAVVRGYNLYTYNSMSTQERLKAVLKKLKDNQVFIGASLESFLEGYKVKHPKQGPLWLAGEIKEISDENMFSSLAHCSKPRQAIIKVTNGGVERYYYNPQILGELSKVEDELSWLLIHEWIRQVHKDSDIIRLTNAYLHSEEFLTSAPLELMSNLRRFGFNSYDPRDFDIVTEGQKMVERWKKHLDALERRGQGKLKHTQAYPIRVEAIKIYNALNKLEKKLVLPYESQSSSTLRKDIAECKGRADKTMERVKKFIKKSYFGRYI